MPRAHDKNRAEHKQGHYAQRGFWKSTGSQMKRKFVNESYQLFASKLFEPPLQQFRFVNVDSLVCWIFCLSAKRAAVFRFFSVQEQRVVYHVLSKRGVRLPEAR